MENIFLIFILGAKPRDGDSSYLGEQQAGEMKRYGGAGAQLSHLLKVNSHKGELDVRVSVLGYIQRGGMTISFFFLSFFFVYLFKLSHLLFPQVLLLLLIV